MTRILVLGGPTGAGKSRIAVEVAERLRGEIMDTDRRAYKEGLKQREVLLRKIIAAVQEAKEPEAA